MTDKEKMLNRIPRFTDLAPWNIWLFQASPKRDLKSDWAKENLLRFVIKQKAQQLYKNHFVSWVHLQLR